MTLSAFTTEQLQTELTARGAPDYRAFAADADAARAERDALQLQLAQLRLSTGLLASINPCPEHQWSPCTRSPVTVCIRCGDRVEGSVAT